MTTQKILTRAKLAATAAPIAIGVALAWAAPVQAQTAAAASQADSAPDTEVVVTGSRISRPELQSASPIAVVSSAAIQNQGITNIEDLATKLPQVGIPGISRTNSNFLTSGNGVQALNLRNLGDQRTLVLVNGRRFVAGLAGTSTVDVNNIPTEMIDRVEVVTGGASAVYGSDAIAGVVNFVLKDSFEGITARGQYGITSRGDEPNWTGSVTGGFKFGPDGRGSVVANFTYSEDKGLLSRDRAISAQDCLYICGPTAYSSYAAQGRFQLMNNGVASGNAGGFQSNLFTFNPDNSVVLGFPTGYGYNRNGVRRIATPITRYLGTITSRYELSDHVTAFLEGTYGKTKSSSQIEASPLASTDIGADYGIDNPFIPAAIAAQIAARNSDGIASNNVTDISFRRRQVEVYTRSNTNSRETFRVAGGFRGDITDKWNYEISGVYGQLKDHTQTQDVDITKYAQALDAIRDSSGNIVCRDPAARAAGCAPINLFGYNTASPQASAYVLSDIPRSDDIKNTELVFNANVAGSLFALPYGDVKTSFGVEYRREKSVDDWDALTNAGQNSGNQTPDTIGKFNVKEVFGELNVPILEDVSFAKSLSVQGQARYSDYSTVGKVFSWSVGGAFAPIRDVRFRANYAIANRAPNIGELYQPPSETFPSVSDPCDGLGATGGDKYAAACRAIPAVAAAIAQNGKFAYSQADLQGINGFDGGNTQLREEKAKTLTAGVVLTPSVLRGFSFSADYFHIKLNNAIGIVPRQTSIEQCLLTGLSQFCGNVIRDPNTGFITTVNAQNVNIASTLTSGIDFDLRYSHKLGLAADDQFDVHVLYTWTQKYKSQSDPSAPNNSGVGNLEYGEVFRHKVNATFDYSVGPFALSWNTTYLSKMVFAPESEFDTPGTIDFLLGQGLTQAQAERAAGHNRIKSRMYHDVQLKAYAGANKQFEMFVGVQNLFDRKPPVLEDGLFPGASITGTTTAADVYDPFGRRFYAGVQVHF